MIKLKLTMIKLIYILEVNKIEKRVIKKVMENISDGLIIRKSGKIC